MNICLLNNLSSKGIDYNWYLVLTSVIRVGVNQIQITYINL